MAASKFVALLLLACLAFSGAVRWEFSAGLAVGLAGVNWGCVHLKHVNCVRGRAAAAVFAEVVAPPRALALRSWPAGVAFVCDGLQCRWKVSRPGAQLLAGADLGCTCSPEPWLAGHTRTTLQGLQHVSAGPWAANTRAFWPQLGLPWWQPPRSAAAARAMHVLRRRPCILAPPCCMPQCQATVSGGPAAGPSVALRSLPGS